MCDCGPNTGEHLKPALAVFADSKVLNTRVVSVLLSPIAQSSAKQRGARHNFISQCYLVASGINDQPKCICRTEEPQ